MRASYIKVTIGSLLNRVPGFLTSMNIKWQKDYPWEIAIANPEIDNLTDTDMQALPHVLDVDCQFVPIHDFVPRKSVDSTPFFGKTNGDSGTARDFYDKGAETFSTVKSRVEQTGNSNGE